MVATNSSKQGNANEKMVGNFEPKELIDMSAQKTSRSIWLGIGDDFRTVTFMKSVSYPEFVNQKTIAYLLDSNKRFQQTY